MKYTREFVKKDGVVVLLCVVFVVLTGGAIGRGGREHGRMVICASRLRQLGLATHDYGIDTGYMPVFGAYEGGAPPNPSAWAHNDPIVGPIISGEPWPSAPDGSRQPENPAVWYDDICRNTPGAALMKNGNLEYPTVFDQACPTSSSVIRLSYGYNYAMLGSSTRPGSFIYRDGDEWLKLSTVQIPSETGMYCDGAAMWGNLDRPWGDNPPRTGGWGIYYWEPSFWPDIQPGDPEWSPFYGDMQIIGHRKGMLVNIGFVDGHVEAVPPEEVHASQSHDWYDPKIYIWLRDKRFTAYLQPSW